MAIKRGMMKEQLKKRLSEQQAGKNKGLNDFESYFETPEGVNVWQTKPGKADGIDYGFDIVPFIVGTKYPTNGYNINEGDLAYVLDVWVHFKVGPMNKPVPCPLKNYGLPCPICESRVDILNERGQMDKDLYKKFKKENSYLFPSRRVMYNVIVRNDEKEEKKGIQIYEISHFFMEKKLQEAAKKPRGGGLIPYPDPDEGKTIWINFSLSGEDTWSVGVPQFEDRNYIITDEEIEAAYQLDELLVSYEYDEIVELMAIKNSHVVETEPEQEPEQPLIIGRRRKLEQEVHEESKEADNNVNTETGEVFTKDKCPYDAVFGVNYDEYTECDNCKVSDDCLAKKEADAMAVVKQEKKKLSPRKKLKTSTDDEASF